ncbi:MAG: hypothetical protein NC037_02845 [Bacteroides sp.]|nr:hypothetical protein [Bacillota bacterium]MCM1393820.1 hypothetical protein [[Eubacterium] siraeum]MCM1455451.1 hypothetical protein [Bacteroides sp.]
MKHKKSLVAIILCIVLIFSLFALVACGDKGNNDNDENISSAVDFAKHAILYAKNSSDDINYSIIGTLTEDSEKLYTHQNLKFEKGRFGYIGARYAFAPDTTVRKACYIFFYNSESEATAGMAEINEQFPDSTVSLTMTMRQNGKVLISESEEGVYNEIMSAQPVEGFPIDTISNFVKDALAAALPNNDAVGVSCYGYSEKPSDEPNGMMQLFIRMLNFENDAAVFSNEDYMCYVAEQEDLEEALQSFNDGLGTEFTSDSYAKIENGVLYAHLIEIPEEE